MNTITVETYIANAPVEAQSIMNELRALILATVPDAEEEIGWNVPVYKYHGVLAGFDVAKQHVSFGVDVLDAASREELAALGYKTGSNTIQIKFDQVVPSDVIKKLLQTQASHNENKG